MGLFAQSPPKAHAEQENTNQPLCLFAASSGPLVAFGICSGKLQSQIH